METLRQTGKTRIRKIPHKKSHLYTVEVLWNDKFVETGRERSFKNAVISCDTYDYPDTTDKNEDRRFFPITKLHRDDLEFAGFDTTNVSDGQMQELASKMGSDYVEQLFWTQIDIIADMMDIPRKEEVVNN